MSAHFIGCTGLIIQNSLKTKKVFKMFSGTYLDTQKKADD